jgi:hypothetical protein
MYFQDALARELSIGSVWFDEWFGALLAALTSVRKGESEGRIQLDSERDPLTWLAKDGVISFNHRGDTVSIQDLEGFTEVLKRAVLDLTDRYRSHPNWRKCTEFQRLRSWAEGPRI